MHDLKQYFLSFYEKNKLEKFVITTHKHADLDGVVSAYALKTLFPNSKLAFHEDMNYASQHFLSKYSIDYEIFDPKKDEKIIVVDSRAKILLPHVADKTIELIIDHHETSINTMKAPYEIIDKDALATAEIIARIYPKEFEEFTAYALAVAILSDTYRFKSSSIPTFEIFSNLLKKSKRSYDECLEDAFPKIPNDEAKAILSNLKRLSYVEINDYIIAYSTSSMKEGDSASLMAEVADMAFVIKEVENGCRISARAHHMFPIPLNKIMEEVGEKGGGAGGGHPKAAGAFVALKKEDAIQLVLSIIKQKLS